MSMYEERKSLEQLKKDIQKKKSALKKGDKYDRKEFEDMIQTVVNVMVSAGIAFIVVPKIEEVASEFVSSCIDRYDDRHKNSRKYAMVGGKKYVLDRLESLVNFVLDII